MELLQGGEEMTLLWKPLLASSVPMDTETNDFAWELVPLPCYASPKLDGFRCMVQGGKLVSRNGLAIRNRELQARYGRPEYEGLDGELCDGKPATHDVFNRSSKVVNNTHADASKTTLYVIGFNSGYEDTFKQRWAMLKDGYRGFEKYSGVILIKQMLVARLDALKLYAAKNEELGYEGTMIVRADLGPYPQKPGKENRSTLKEGYLLRLKRFEYEYAVIVAVHPLEHNENTEKTAAGRRSSRKAGITVDATCVGSATLRDVKTGVEFNTTIGAERLRAWKGWPRALGTRVRYKYQVCGTKDKPRINSCSFEELGVKG
jgi:hypothetical protein